MTLIVCGGDGSAGACAQAGVARASATKSAAALCVVVTEWLPRILSDQPDTGRIAGVGKSFRELILPGLWRRPGGPSRKRQLDLTSEVGRLRRENARLRMGRDIKSSANRTRCWRKGDSSSRYRVTRRVSRGLISPLLGSSPT